MQVNEHIKESIGTFLGLPETGPELDILRTSILVNFSVGQKQKEPEINDFRLFLLMLLSISAPQVGLEPTTYGLTVRRSNQLSY